MFPFPFSFVAPAASGLADIDNVYSMDFDGVNDYIEPGLSMAGGDISISYWVNADGSYTPWKWETGVLVKPSNNVINQALGGFYVYSTSLYPGFQGNDSAGGNYSTYTVRGLGTFAGLGWKHVVWTYNDTSKIIYVYVDGVAQTWTNFGGTVTTPYVIGKTTLPADTYSTVIIGKSSFIFTPRYWPGKLDEVALFDYVLDSDQALEIYNATSAGKTADLSTMATPPVAWYRMGD